MKLECAWCIQEKITEGKWDRFGTTAEQEIEAMCMRHLEEAVKLYTFIEDQSYRTMLEKEIERRKE